MKVIGICGSPRKGSNSAVVLDFIGKELTSLNHSFSVSYLAESVVEYCCGCLSCEDEGNCPINDDAKSLLELIKGCDAVVLSTPAYFDSVPGKLKSLIDRMNLIVSALKSKKMIVTIVGQADETSWNAVAEYLGVVAGITGIDLLGREFFHSRKSGDLILDDEKKSRLTALSRRLIADS